LKGFTVGQILNSLKFVSAKRLVGSTDPVQFRRQKMIKRLEDQIAMAQAFAEGRQHTLTRPRRSIDPITGQNITLQVPGALRPWWFMSESGKVAVQLRYGSKTIALSKGRNAVEVNSPEELVSVLQTFKTAVAAGELDNEIAVAADAVRARFNK
jgi:hypothetical protein